MPSLPPIAISLVAGSFVFTFLQLSHANREIVHHAEIAGPILTRGEHRRNSFGHGRRRRLCDAKQNDAVRCLSASPENQFAEILVESYEQTAFSQGAS